MPHRRLKVMAAFSACLLAACQQGPTKEEIEAAKNTVDCERPGERVVVRYADGEARILLMDGTRVVLYQVPSGSGVRYINGLMEWRGKGNELEFVREQTAVHFICKPYELPKQP